MTNIRIPHLPQYCTDVDTFTIAIQELSKRIHNASIQR